MKEEKLQQLFKEASCYRFTKFDQLVKQYAQEDSTFAELPDIYLLQAQIKLITTDASFYEDLLKANSIKAKPTLPCLCRCWHPDTPNALIVFNKQKGDLERYLEVLPASAQLLEHWYGVAGSRMAHHMKSQIFYFLGRFSEAIAIAKDLYYMPNQNYPDMIEANYVLLRCYLATGQTREAQDILRDIIRLVRYNKEDPASEEMYQVIRKWTNITTGWSGDTPRYHETPDGMVLPVLEDRTSEIRTGISELSPKEQPYVDYAALYFSKPYTMRQLYMDVYHAMHYFRAGLLEEAAFHFDKAYQATEATGLIMPFVEYGMQILPLLRYILDTDPERKYKIVYQFIPLCERYEASINMFRQ